MNRQQRMAEEPNKPVEEKAEDLADVAPEVELTGKETPDELKAKLAEERKLRSDERAARKKTAEALKQQNARARKAEAALKDIAGNGEGGEKKPEQKPAASDNAVDVDERILKANGMSDELLKELKDIAALRKVSLIDAQNDPLFKRAKEEFDRKKKSEDASMGAGKGSGSSKGAKSPNDPGLSRDEHKKMVEEKWGN